MPDFKIVLTVLLSVFLSACGTTKNGLPAETFFLKIASQTSTGSTSSKQIAIQLKRLTTYQQQAKGLMHQSHIAAKSGVLIEFKTEAKRGIWMKNMLIPIDVLFLNKKGKPSKLMQNLPPCKKGDNCPIYSADRTQFIIELPAGFIKKNKITLENTFLKTSD